MNYRAVSCMLSAAMCLMNLLSPFDAGAYHPADSPAALTDAAVTEQAYTDEFDLHLDVFGHQVYETVAPITNYSVSNPSVAFCVVPESKDYINIQALSSGTSEIIVTLANGDVYAVHLTVGNVKSTDPVITTAPNITTAPVTTTTAAPIETTTLPETTTSAPVTTTAASFTTVVPGSEVSAKDDDEGVMIYYTRGSGELPAYFEIPSEYEGKPVYGVADNGFSSMQELVHVKIPDTVILIGKNGFSSCSNLEKVDLPSGLIGIDDYAFDCCSALKNVILPDTVTNLGSGAFRAAGLQSVLFSNKLAIMGQECFHNCDALTEITLPATLKTVGKQTFYNCDNLKSATVAGPVCSELMFGECPKLESVTFLDPNCNIFSNSNTVCNEMAAPTRGMYNGVIRGYVGSTAQKYAESWNYRFEPLDPENYVTTPPAITTPPTATTTAVTTTAAGKADIGFEISEDAWSFDSDSSSFFRENKAGVYERLLTASDYQTLKDFCSELDWYGMGGINDHLVEHGNGTCYGMALTALMNYLHMFRPSDLDASAGTLKKLNKENETVISAINYHQLLQYRVACQEAIDQGKTDARLFNDLLALAEAGKPAFVILSNDYKDPLKSHAVLAIGCKRYAEKISLTLWDGSHEFDGYIRLYDPTKPHEEVKMYFNQEEHAWYLDNAKFQKCGNWEDNIALRAVFSEWDVLMKGSLFAEPDAAEEAQSLSLLTYQTAGAPNEPEWIDPNTGKPSVGASSANILRKRNVFSINGTGSQLMEKYVADPLYKNDAFRFSFPDQKADSAQVEMRYADTLYYIASDLLRDAVFSPDGMTISTEKAPYTLRTVRNTAPGSDAICLLSISGSGTGKTEFRQTADGTEWILSTDSPLGIGALEITAESRAGTETKKVLTAAKKICIYAESSGKISVRYEFCKNGDEPIVVPADEAENGDVNFDGAISVEDAQLALRQYTASVAENPDVLPEDNRGKMDVNGDGELSVDDAQLILMYYTQKTVAQKNITWEDLLRQ